MFVSATNKYHVNSLFTSLLGDCTPSLHLTAGECLIGTGHALCCTSLSILGHRNGSQVTPYLSTLL